VYHRSGQHQSVLVGQRALQDDVDTDAHAVGGYVMARSALAAQRARRVTAACTSDGAAAAATVVPGESPVAMAAITPLVTIAVARG
jgi:hypothetical protein